MENSLTLNAGDKIAHWGEEDKKDVRKMCLHILVNDFMCLEEAENIKQAPKETMSIVFIPLD